MDHEEKYNTARWDAGQVRREGGERPTHSAQSAASEERRRRNRRKGRERRFLLWLIFVVAVSAILAGVGWLLANDMCAFNKEPVTATIEVTKYDDVNSIATKLKNEGLIEYKWFFKLFGAVRHAGDKIGIGTYELNTDMDYNALIQGMSNRNATINADTVTVTIPEGYSVRQIVSLLAKYGVNSEEALLSAAERGSFDYSFLDSGKSGIAKLEGYLFPETYDFLKGDTVHNYVATFYAQFDAQFTKEMYAALKKQDMTLPELVTLASFVQEEAGNSQDSNVAQVFRNRLAEGSPYPRLQSNTSSHVQSDADNNYLWNWVAPYYGGWDDIPENILAAYDTYSCTGLPAGPISNPGLAAIKAALEPQPDEEAKDAYFFVTDLKGNYYYAHTLAEHNANCKTAAAVNKSLKN